MALDVADELIGTFGKCDVEGTGLVDCDKLVDFFKSRGLPQDIRKLVDPNGTGRVDYRSFTKWAFTGRGQSYVEFLASDGHSTEGKDFVGGGAALENRAPSAPHVESLKDGDDSVWSQMLTRMAKSMLPPGEVKSAVVIGAGASGLMCARMLEKKGVKVRILEGRGRIGGRLYTDPDGLDMGGHWIHGGGPDPDVALYSADNIMQEELNPVRRLCDEFGIETKLTDGNSCYIGESDAEVREISFFWPDGTPMVDDGPAETELWEVYEMVMHKVHELEQTMSAQGIPEGDMSLQDAIDKVVADLEPPLTKQQQLFLQWHLETEYGGDYGDDPKGLSFFHYDGGTAGEYASFPGGDRILVGGYTVLIERLAATLTAQPELNKVVTHIARKNREVSVACADGTSTTADVCIVTLPLGVLQRQVGVAGHVAFSPPLPEWKSAAISRGRMGCLNKLFLVFDKCYWPREQYTFAYINAKPDEYPSMLVNLWPSHHLPILTCLVGGDAGRAMESRSAEENVSWAMELVHKLFGADVPLPCKSVQTAWDQDPFSYGGYSCAGKGIHAGDQILLSEPVDGRVFFAGEHTNPMFWGCVHGAIVSGLREAARITGDTGMVEAFATSKLASKRAVQMRKVNAKLKLVASKLH